MNLDKITANKRKYHRTQLLCHTYFQESSHCICFKFGIKNNNNKMKVRNNHYGEKKPKKKKKDEMEKLCRNQFDSPLMVPLWGKMIGPKQRLYHFFSIKRHLICTLKLNGIHRSQTNPTMTNQSQKQEEVCLVWRKWDFIQTFKLPGFLKWSSTF